MLGLLRIRIAVPRVVAAAAMILSSFITATMPAQQTSAMAPFACDGNLYMVRGTTPENVSRLYRIDRTTDPANLDDEVNEPLGLHIGSTALSDTTAYPKGFLLNALGYNPVDQYFYAARIPNQVAGESQIYRIGSDGDMELAATLTMPPGSLQALPSATFGPDGTYYAKTSGSTLAIVTGLDAAPATPVSTTFVTTSQDIEMGDIAFDMKNNRLFVISNVDGSLYTVNTTTGALTLVTQAGINDDLLPPTDNYAGSAFFDASNELYIYINDYDGTEGAFAHVNTTNGNITVLQSAPLAFRTDGASCVPVDQKIDVVKHAGAVTAENATTFRMPYTLMVGNNSPQPLQNVQVVDNLRRTFAAGNPALSVSAPTVTDGSCTANTGFNGDSDIRLLAGTDTLATGESCTIGFTVALVYPSSDVVPQDAQDNTALASSALGENEGHQYLEDGTIVPPVNVLAVDTSTDASDLPGTPNGDTSSPTPVLLRYQAPEQPQPPQLANTGLDEMLISGVGFALITIGAVAIVRVRTQNN